jgi:DNA modification methylase
MTVLDPFLGIGHSAIAAATCGAARFIGFELDPVYHAEACERVAALSAPTCGADPGLFD